MSIRFHPDPIELAGSKQQQQQDGFAELDEDVKALKTQVEKAQFQQPPTVLIVSLNIIIFLVMTLYLACIE